MEKWKNKIVETKTMKLEELVPNPRNWRKHPQKQQRALGGAISEVGYVQPVTFNRITGRLVDGHLRVKMAIEAGETELPTTIVELTENEERVVLATLDPIGALATSDLNSLGTLTSEIETNNQSILDLFGQFKELDMEIEESIEDPTGRRFSFSMSEQDALIVDSAFLKIKESGFNGDDSAIFLEMSKRSCAQE